MTNFMDPDKVPVRVLLMLVMLASLLMSIAIPDAFGDRALLFAGSYVALQIVRNAFIAWSCPPASRIRLNSTVILIWSLVSGALFIAGALMPAEARVPVWILALAIDYAGPAARYWVPGMPRAETGDWAIDAGHFSERFQLLVIIALGESIVITGATGADLEMDLARITAIAVAFIGSAALWWLYFNSTARIAGRRLAASDDPGRLARRLHVRPPPDHRGHHRHGRRGRAGDRPSGRHPARAGARGAGGGSRALPFGHLLFRLRMAGSDRRRRRRGEPSSLERFEASLVERPA
jgi:low temperature requirement protein LtrA